MDCVGDWLSVALWLMVCDADSDNVACGLTPLLSLGVALAGLFDGLFDGSWLREAVRLALGTCDVLWDGVGDRVALTDWVGLRVGDVVGDVLWLPDTLWELDIVGERLASGETLGDCVFDTVMLGELLGAGLRLVLWEGLMVGLGGGLAPLL
jgi:hypothetical protein